MNTENNKIIAEFMGAKEIITETTHRIYKEFEMYGIIESIEDREDTKHFYQPEEMLFNSDWNWLMEVVEKIENLPSRTLQGNYYLGNEVKIYKAINTNTHYCEINLVKESGYRIVSIQFNKESKIKSVYDACLEFIKWYNEQK